MNNILKIRNTKSIASKLLIVCFAMFFCITISYAQISVATVNTDPYCIGGTTGSIKLTASGGTAPYTFQMTSPSVGAINSNASTYTYTGLAAGSYQFKITDFNGNIQSRTIVLANPAPVSYFIPSNMQTIATVCDSVDFAFGIYVTGTARPNYKFEFWTNSSSATGIPTITFNNNVSLGTTFRIPAPNVQANTFARMTDSCGNIATCLFIPIDLSYRVNPSAICGASDLEALFKGLTLPVTSMLYSGSTATGSALQTVNQSIATIKSDGGANYYTGGSFINVPTGTYTIKVTDACGKIVTKTINYTAITKVLPSAAASISCNQTSVDSTTSFRINGSTWAGPSTFTIVSGPATYNHTNITGIINPNITYPITRSGIPSGTGVELTNVPMGTYRIALLDACGWTDTVTYVIDASNIVKINMTGTVTPGCLNANSLTVNVTDGCSRPQHTLHLLNSSGADLGSSGLTSNNTSFTVNNLPAGNYYFALYGMLTTSFTSGGTSILQHVTTPVSMKVPFTINPYVQPSVSGVLVAPCPNTSVGSLIATPLNGVAPYTYELMAPSPSTTVLAGPQASDTFSGIATNNTYRIRVTDLCGNASVSSNVSLNSLSTTLTATASPLGCIVSGSAVTLTADTLNATVYSWSGPNGFTATGRTVNIPNVTSNKAGTYTVTATTVGSCINTATVVLNVKPNAGADITGVCNGGTQSLTGLPAGGTWAAQASNPSGASIASNNVTFSLLANGNYNFIYTLNGCTDTVAMAVTTCSLAITNTCPASTANLTTHVDSTGKPAGTIITWHTATPPTDANKVANPVSVGAGVYYAAYWDALIGCYSPASASLAVNITPCCPAIPPAITPTNVTVCSPSIVNLFSLPITTTAQAGERLVFSTHNPPANSNDTLITAQASAITTSGMYYAFYKNAYCVGAADSVQIIVNQKPNAGADHFIECGSGKTTDTLKGLPTVGIWSAMSSNPTGITLGSTVNGNSVIGLPNAPTTGTYKFIYTAPNGCTDTMNLVIGLPTNPNPAVNMGSNPICKNGTVQLCPTVWGYSNYQWYKNGVAIAAPIGTASCIALDSTGIGSYTLAATNGSGCWTNQSIPIIVTYDNTCTNGSVTNPTGLESKSLGDVIAQRLFGNAKNSIVEDNGYSNATKFVQSGVITNGTQDLKLTDLVPATVTGTDIAYNKTPVGLLSMVTAEEVLGITYTKNNTAKAALFASKTLGEVYAHTKPVCDRLSGAKLLEVKTITVKGYNLTAYKIEQCTGQIEYAINLSAGTATNRNTIGLQSNWFTENYQQDQKLYNFQLWAVSYDIVTAMATDIITKLESIAPINQLTNNISNLPEAFITEGSRNGTKINLNIQNNSTATNAYFEINEKLNENAAITTRIIPIAYLPINLSTNQLEVKDAYEASIYLYVNGKKADMVYLNDGTWSKGYSAATTLQSFNITNSLNATNVANGEYKLLRDVSFAAITKDYFSVYKAIGTKCQVLSLNNYNSFKFNASATGAKSVMITLISKNIANWEEQYSYTTDLDGAKEYGINLSQFASSKYNTLVAANEITGVNFSFNGSRNTATLMTASISNARFSNAAISNNNLSVGLGIYPNPTTGNFTVAFVSESAIQLVLKVTDIATGRVVKTQFINAAKGNNKTAVELSNNLPSSTYIVTLEGDDFKCTPAKLIINRK